MTLDLPKPQRSFWRGEGKIEKRRDQILPQHPIELKIKIVNNKRKEYKSSEPVQVV